MTPKSLERSVRRREGVVFKLELEAGPIDIEAWLIDSEGERMGAYFVYAEQI